MTELAIVTLTPNGQDLGHRLAEALGQGVVFSEQSSAKETIQQIFQAGQPLICIMALGIVVRILGPLAKNKKTDPAVVVIDEAGQFAISVLGGHAGGANELAKKAAKAIGAVPVITTASDALGLPPLDLIGRDWGWKIERPEYVKPVAAAMVRGETIGVYQDIGRRDWWRGFGEWPMNFQRIKFWSPQGYWAGLLVITDLALPKLDLYPSIVYRPPTLILGVGCRRGVPYEQIEAMFQDIFREQGFSPLSLGAVVTATLKADEPGLVEFATRHDVPLRAFTLEKLAAVPDLPSPSKNVHRKFGVWGVAEPAAILAAGTNRLVMPKQRGERITMALARREDA